MRVFRPITEQKNETLQLLDTFDSKQPAFDKFGRAHQFEANSRLTCLKRS